MTTIQDRLRKDVFYGEERMHKFSKHNPLHMDAADRIDALEKALRGCRNELLAHARNEFDGVWLEKDFDDMIAPYNAALGEGE